MKNIKKLLAVVLAAALCLSVAACGAATTSVETLETSSAVSEGETAPADKDPAGYDSDIQGMCKYFEDNHLAVGEKVQMSYDVIGALNGYKYAYRYNDSNVQLELYEFPTEDIPEAAQSVINSLRAEGSFTILDNTVPGYLSGDGRFLMIYTDAKSEKDEVSKAHKAHVLSCFDAFAEKTGK
ncbi:hypothetical protein [Anaeromassilibacillus senegalensis]|uniref:DUF4358 domain-containing protein n=1 Tax=Anaeromassilibacillus senegalensis TaxID=1673717 RepID=A0ABS9CTP3_9FIRM|nr:hypothetical protein [Anaeromassilibacillus senegalensis]MCF2653314.1 hypothetical protein [Anaeromassilibacillus senegalensis]MCI5652600.1 hypothetical protein [Ruminococcus bromii]